MNFAHSLGLDFELFVKNCEQNRMCINIQLHINVDMAIGIITSEAGSPKGIRAKLKIAELLDIPINSVDLFKSQTGV